MSEEKHSAKPHAPVSPDVGPLRPPRPPIGLPLLPDGRVALPPGNPCEGCDHCCRYATIAIKTPRTHADFDAIRWYVLHRHVSVVCDWDNVWMVQLDLPCEWLVEGRCSHYRLRPDVCRDHDPADCERYGGNAEKILIRNERDLDGFLSEREQRNARRRKRSNGRRAASA